MDIFSDTVITAILGCFGFYFCFYFVLFICVLVKISRQETCSNELKLPLLVVTLQLLSLGISECKNNVIL